MRSAFTKDLEKIPEYLRSEGMEKDMYAMFLQKHYFHIVRSVVQKLEIPRTFKWEPPFPIERLPDQDAQDAARQLK